LGELQTNMLSLRVYRSVEYNAVQFKTL